MAALGVIYEQDVNGRDIRIFRIYEAQVSGQSHYPGVRLFSYKTGEVFNPIREQVMSMPDLEIKSIGRPTTVGKTETRPVFFFVYNVDNYYHFLYDSLPYLISYQYLKEKVPGLKLLINFANDQQTKLNPFVTEFLELLHIYSDDMLFLEKDTVYGEVFISSSYTHDGKSNLPPRQEVYSLYNGLADKIDTYDDFPKKIYVSRRSHIHGHYENIGTNYTTKRRLDNEDQLVTFLESKGYTEVFTELLDTRTKIAMFKGCTHVVGAIGGGLCNVLFSGPQTKLTAIVSPYFLDINKRFCYSFANVDVGYFTDTRHIETSEYKRHMRVRIKPLNIVGEVQDITDSTLSVIYSDEAIAGWNAQTEYRTKIVHKDGVESIDPGLNCAWTMDLAKFAETTDV
jgi:capsular polysaccharide biosynthesis protein